jgi:hypothetical protein
MNSELWGVFFLFFEVINQRSGREFGMSMGFGKLRREVGV